MGLFKERSQIFIRVKVKLDIALNKTYENNNSKRREEK